MRIFPFKSFSALSIFVLFLLPQFSLAQIGAGCPNANFGSGNFSNWVAYTGSYTSCCTTAGVVAGRHTMMNSPINDPIVGTTCTNGPLPVLPPGTPYSARLGNSSTGSQADRLRYSLTVDSSNALFIYKYAVVLQDPSHTVSSQPKFDVKLLNTSGQQIGGSCGAYSVAAGANIPGFNSCGDVRWKPWTVVGVDLLPFYGQTVTLEFTTYDCNLGGHYGYAYIAADCSPLYIDINYCPGDNSVQLNAPPGFSSYLWETGATTSSINVTNPQVGDTVSVVMTTFSNSGNCTVTLEAILSPTQIWAGFDVNYPCEDVVIFQDTTQVQFGYIQSWLWNFGDGTFSTLQNPTHVYSGPGTYNVTLISYSKPGQTGCSDTTVVPVTVYANPVAGFTSNVYCVGGQSTFTDTSIANDPNGFASWLWTFSGGTPYTDTQQNPTTVFSGQGTHQVKLVVTNTNGCMDSITVPVTTTSFPVDFYHDTVCVGGTTSFNDLSVPNAPDTIVNWFWDFGDGSTGSGTPSPTHTYATSGTYLVELLVVTSFGCTDSISKIVTVSPNALASFIASDVCALDSVHFTDQSYVALPSVVNSWQWDFGDGNTSTAQHPVHLYAAPGSYAVTLYITSSNGCFGTLTDTVNVFDYPQTSFTSSDICLNSPSPFTNTSVNPSDGTISNFIWDFGDGNQNTVDQNPTHTYTSSGTYTVQLINYSSNLSCPDTFTQQVTVNPEVQAGYSFVNACTGSNTTFTDLSTGPVISWEWNFDDGSPLDTNQNPVHVFVTAGLYNVQLVVTSSFGCQDTLTQLVEVFPLPTPDFSVMDVCVGEAANFFDLSTAPTGYSVVGHVWDFGNGNTSTNQNPVYTYTDTGDFQVTLYVTTDKGCIDSITKTIEVHPYPEVDFTMNRHEGCYPVCIQFSGNVSIGSGDSINSYAWTFGDGGTSFQKNLQYCYSNPGNYSVTLVATSNFGCATTRTYTDTINVYDYPTARFEPSPRITTTTNPIVTFINNSIGGYTWNWNFGDNVLADNANEKEPSHTYISAGSYLVTLYTENIHGCGDSAHFRVIVEPEFTIYVPNSFTPNGDGLNDVFKPKGIGVDEYELQIFNRWGQLVFESNNIEIGWDGTVNKLGGKSQAPQDVYVYKITARNVFGQVPFGKEGHVSLIR